MASQFEEVEKLIKQIEQNQIGNDQTIEGPFGPKKLIYTDHTASGRSLKFIEEYISSNVLPLYANTHSGTSHCSRQTTFFREEARDIIRDAVNASDDDCVLFAGSGCTGAVHKIIGGLNLRESSKPVVVFVGPFEHHSNLLPWRDLGAKIITARETSEGLLDLVDLEDKLKAQSGNADKLLIGAFNAASNLTGVLTDTITVSCLLHRYGALSLWDYASAAPYTKIDMNPVITSANAPLAYKDAVYYSMHKFVGGVDSPGILVAKKCLFKNSTPNQSGGGTVFFVTPSHHRYFRTIEMREEGGTPNIIGSIRAGLAMRVKQAIGVDHIMKKEESICSYVYSQWSHVPGLVVTGPAPSSVPRLPIFSLIFTHPPSGKLLHHNFICAILSDLFGIQARGGCSCAGPYAQSLLGISEQLADRYEAIIMQDHRLFQEHLHPHEFSEREVLRPGMTRLSFPYFLSQAVIDYIVKSVVLIAEHGWKLLPLYQFNPETGLFRHPDHHPDKERVWLSSLIFSNSLPDVQPIPSNKKAPGLKEALDLAQKVFKEHSVMKTDHKMSGDHSSFLTEEAEELRWFLLPSEAEQYLDDQTPSQDHISPSPFKPRVYSDGKLNTPEQRKDGQTEQRDRSEEGSEKEEQDHVKFHHPPKAIMKNAIEAINDFNMIHHGDRVLVCLSGGKDSLSLLHTLKQYQYICKSNNVQFELGAVTVDPGSSAYNPRPLIPYLAALGEPYFFEEQAIIQQAVDLPEVASICSFCSRMKRGRLYSCARRERYNVLALGQHLDDLAESFLMSVFHNGSLRTMKAHYTVKEGDLRVIRPFVYVRERDLNSFAKHAPLPIIPDNCPACFAAPKERERVKQLLAAQEILFPRLYHSLLAAMKPLMEKGLENDEPINLHDED